MNNPSTTASTDTENLELRIILRLARKEFKRIKTHPISGFKNWKDHKEEVRNIINLYKISNLSLDKFCLATNITYQTLYYYLNYVILDQMPEPLEINPKTYRIKKDIKEDAPPTPVWLMSQQTRRRNVPRPESSVRQLGIPTSITRLLRLPKSKHTYEAEIILVMRNDPKMKYSVSFIKNALKEKLINDAIENLIKSKIIIQSKNKKVVHFAENIEHKE